MKSMIIKHLKRMREACWQENKFYILSFLAFLALEIFFHSQIDFQVSKSGLVQWFDIEQSSIWKDIAFSISILLFFLCNFYLPKIRSQLLIFIILISTHYLICRFSSDFYFYNTTFFNQLYYMDFLLVALIVSLVFKFKDLYNGYGKNVKAKKTKDIHSALINLSEDQFNRVYFAQNFIEAYEQSSKTIFGIEGAWGSGKTTVLNFIKILMKEKATIIEFNPWFCLSREQIIPEFFSLLKDKLNELDPKGSVRLQNEIRKYSNLLTADYSKVINTFLLQDDSRSEEFNRINELLERVKLEKPIIVLIDDLDRLEDSYVLECLKLIKLIAHFDSLNFIVTYDKSHILNAINKYEFDNKYTDKVFPQEISLPEIGSDKLASYLIELIKQDLPDEDFHVAERHFNNLLQVLNVQFETIREVMKVYSSFITSLSFLKDKILLDELLLIEILRSKNAYFNVFKDLYNQRAVLFHLQQRKERVIYCI